MNVPSYISTEFPINPLEKLQLKQQFPAGSLDELYVDAQTLGNMMIYFDAGDEARVLGVGEKHLLPNRVEIEGSRLVIEAQNLKRFFNNGQSEKIRIEVHVPARTRVTAHFGAGALFLAGGEGEVNIKGGVGEISGYTHTGNINVRLRAGDITLANIHGQAALNLNVGSINLSWSELTGDEHVEAHCDLGTIDLHLPPAIAPIEDQGGLFLRKTVDVPFSTHINALVGFGALDVLPAKSVGVTA